MQEDYSVRDKIDQGGGVPDNATSGWYDYLWDGTKPQTLHVYFKSNDGLTTGNTDTTFTVPMNYHSQNNPLLIDIKIPKPSNFAGINNFTIYGAFGISSMDSNGICAINPPTHADYYITVTPASTPLVWCLGNS